MKSKYEKFEKDLKETIDSLKELGLSEEVIKQKWEQYLKTASEIHKDLPPELDKEFIIKKRALANLKRLKARVSKLKEIKGICIGFTERRDLIAIMKRIATSIWEKDPERAVAEGYTDEEGRPLDNRPTIMGRPNPNFGKPLPDDAHAYIRQYFFITPKGWLVILTAREDKSAMPCQIGKWYSFKANIRQVDESLEIVRASTSVVTQLTELMSAPEIDLKSILSKYMEPLEDGLDETEFFIAQALVVRKGNGILVVDDPNYHMRYPEAVGFYREDLQEVIDKIEVNDLVWIIGRGRKFTFETGERVFDLWGVGKW